MADAMRFDVLEAMDELKAAGFSDGQARTLADTLQHVAAVRQGDLATKSDLRVVEANLRAELAELRTELRGDIAGLRTELKSEAAGLRGELAEQRAEFKRDIAELETRLLKAMADQQRWTIGITLTAVGLLFAAIKLL